MSARTARHPLTLKFSSHSFALGPRRNGRVSVMSMSASPCQQRAHPRRLSTASNVRAWRIQLPRTSLRTSLQASQIFAWLDPSISFGVGHCEHCSLTALMEHLKAPTHQGKAEKAGHVCFPLHNFKCSQGQNPTSSINENTGHDV